MSANPGTSPIAVITKPGAAGPATVTQKAPPGQGREFETSARRRLTIEDTIFHLPYKGSKLGGDLLCERKHEKKGESWELHIIADISGHGLEAENFRSDIDVAVETAINKYLLAHPSGNPPSPAEILKLAEAEIKSVFEEKLAPFRRNAEIAALQKKLFPQEKLDNSAEKALDTYSGKFVTLACVVFDLEKHELTHASAGQEAILRYSAMDKKTAPLDSEVAMPVFFDDFLCNKNGFTEKTVKLAEGDIVLLLTDGIFDLFRKRKLTEAVFSNVITHYESESTGDIMKKLEGIMDAAGAGGALFNLQEVDDATMRLFKVQ
ncbi:Stage II sporulation protein E (SpoIIE) [Candidatus Burarchaeum australiense]|nr:Stage II sporulation protein E (SpoIIE) [Candidatus Burarchaeum australiense]